MSVLCFVAGFIIWLYCLVNECMRYRKTVVLQDPPEAEDFLTYFVSTYANDSFRLIQQLVVMSIYALTPLR